MKDAGCQVGIVVRRFVVIAVLRSLRQLSLDFGSVGEISTQSLQYLGHGVLVALKHHMIEGGQRVGDIGYAHPLDSARVVERSPGCDILA